ncbi:hypothetical protein IKQ26_05830 [bacterium]|nr:hypothetical protein [bacterium]
MEFDATFFIAAISFILFTFIMNKIFYAPVMKIMEDREIYVSNNYEEVKSAKVKIKENTDSKNERLEVTRNEGRGIISEKTNEAKRQNTEKIRNAKQQTNENITKMKEELVDQAQKSKEVLLSNVVDISKEISQKLLGSEINTDNITADKIKGVD